MIDYTILAKTVARRSHVDLGTAYSAVGEAYLTADLTRNEAQIAAYLIRKAQFVLLTEFTRRDILGDALDYSRGVANNDGDVEELCVASPIHKSDAEFAQSVADDAPGELREAVLCVVSKLLDHAPTKRLTSESVRQILKAERIPLRNTSRTAREVLEFLRGLA